MPNSRVFNNKSDIVEHKLAVKGIEINSGGKDNQTDKENGG